MMTCKSNLTSLTFTTFPRNVQSSDSSEIVMMILIFTSPLSKNLPTILMSAVSLNKSAAADTVVSAPNLNKVFIIQSSK